VKTRTWMRADRQEPSAGGAKRRPNKRSSRGRGRCPTSRRGGRARWATVLCTCNGEWGGRMARTAGQSKLPGAPIPEGAQRNMLTGRSSDLRIVLLPTLLGECGQLRRAAALQPMVRVGFVLDYSGGSAVEFHHPSLWRCSILLKKIRAKNGCTLQPASRGSQ
jgi:hypothetical protein